MNDHDDWQNDPLLKAAAFEGIAGNLAMPLTDRLDCARQAMGILRAEVDSRDRSIAELSSGVDSRDATIAELGASNARLTAEVERLKTWPGLMSTLAEHYPPASFDGTSGDPGTQIVVLTRELAGMHEYVTKLDARLQAAISTLDDAGIPPHVSLSDGMVALLRALYAVLEPDSKQPALRSLVAVQQAERKVIDAARDAANDIRGLSVAKSAPARALVAAVDGLDAASSNEHPEARQADI